MRRAHKYLTLLGSLGLLTACAGGVAWRSHLSLRSYGAGLTLSEVDPDEPVKAAVRPHLDYVSIAVERVFFRDVPWARSGPVALGIEVTGLTPSGRTIKTVLGLRSAGPQGALQFDEGLVLRPTLYTGRQIAITLRFRRVPKDHLGHLRGQLQMVGDLVRNLDPAREKTLRVPLDAYQRILEGSAIADQPSWSYTMTFFPVSAVRDKPDRILSAARYVLILIPPREAGGAWSRLRPESLRTLLRVEGNRLTWRQTGRDYRATPHVILNVRRFRRYPRTTEVERYLRRADTLFEQGGKGAFFLLGRLALMQAGEALVNDQVLTSPEKNLAREWIRFRSLRFNEQRAKGRGESRAQLGHLYEQVRSLGVIRKVFRRILYQHEVKQIEYQVATLASRIQELSRKLGIEPRKLHELLEVYQLRERVQRLLERRRYPKRVIRFVRALAEQYAPPPGQRDTLSVGMPDAKTVERAAKALASGQVLVKRLKTPDARELEGGVGRPILKRWWFWTLIGVGVTTFAVGTYYGLRGESPTPPGPGLTVPLGGP